MKGIAAAVAISAALLLASFSAQAQEKADQAKARSGKNDKAIAHLSPTKGNTASGVVMFTKEKDGVKVVAVVSGLTEGLHGFHIHEVGDCSAPDGSSAGGHFNPAGNPHGGPADQKRHAGDLGNVEANLYGNAIQEELDHVIKLDGPDSIIGRSVIIHAGQDDLKTQPTGGAGARVACGVITAGEK